MARKRETAIHEAIMRWIKIHCPESEIIKQHGSPNSIRGEPDLAGCIQGFHVCIEVKKPGGELSPSQEKRLRVWAATGAIWGVAESVEDAIDIIRGSGKVVINE